MKLALMTNTKKALLFIVDYTSRGGDRFFLWSNNQLSEVSSRELVQETCEVVCHDYWLIAPNIFLKEKSLPACVTDFEDLRISITGKGEDRKARDRVDFSLSLSEFVDEETLAKYKAIFNCSLPVDTDVLDSLGPAILKCANKFENLAKDADEWQRYVHIERPVADYLVRSAAEGISIDENKLRAHKSKIDFDYYMALKTFSATYNMPLELPSDGEIVNYLEPKGFNFSGVNVDYVLNFVPMQDDFAVDLLNLRKVAGSRKVLIAIPLSQKRIFPIVDWFGSITSRIYFKDPSLQNLSKPHRDILIPDSDMSFSYVDYDQYEAGIMAALSGDQQLMRLYAAGDLYELAAKHIFGDPRKRKEAKRLFLSYAYGMKRKNLIDAAFGYGADRQATRSFFDQFKEFEQWKLSLWEKFKEINRIGTSLGNYLCRDLSGKLTEKEKRSAVSQVVQGTASLIFKKALLELQKEPHIQLKLPMHDAVLFQHPIGFDTNVVVEIFSRVMSTHFKDTITGKASLAQFAPPHA
jgi:DNA polymerase I